MEPNQQRVRTSNVIAANGVKRCPFRVINMFFPQMYYYWPGDPLSGHRFIIGPGSEEHAAHD
jgi:hypothetical protein